MSIEETFQNIEENNIEEYIRKWGPVLDAHNPEPLSTEEARKLCAYMLELQFMHNRSSECGAAYYQNMAYRLIKRLIIFSAKKFLNLNRLHLFNDNSDSNVLCFKIKSINLGAFMFEDKGYEKVLDNIFEQLCVHMITIIEEGKFLIQPLTFSMDVDDNILIRTAIK